MSYYYKYEFVSPEGIYATIREELKSYMDTGVIDDLMFPTYLDKCLRKLGRSTYVITETILHIEDFKSRLPDNFYAVREAWACAEIRSGSYQCASSMYSQTSVINNIDVTIPTTTTTTLLPTTTTTTTIDCNLEGIASEVCDIDCNLEGTASEECTPIAEATPTSGVETTLATTTTISTTCSPVSSVIQILPATIGGEPCILSACLDDCSQYTISQEPYKITGFINYTYQRKYLLKPGNISVRENCDVNYMENWTTFSQENIGDGGIPYSSSYDSFDIRDNKFVTTFRKGVVDIVFYATEYDETGNQLVPDNYRIKEYIEAFIKYKMFEQLMNVVTDESINQIERKVQYYERKADEAYILADSELRRETMWEKQRRIKRSLRSLDMYELPGDHRRKSSWRRNR